MCFATDGRTGKEEESPKRKNTRMKDDEGNNFKTRLYNKGKKGHILVSTYSGFLDTQSKVFSRFMDI